MFLHKCGCVCEREYLRICICVCPCMCVCVCVLYVCVCVCVGLCVGECVYIACVIVCTSVLLKLYPEYHDGARPPTHTHTYLLLCNALRRFCIASRHVPTQITTH